MGRLFVSAPVVCVVTLRVCVCVCVRVRVRVRVCVCVFGTPMLFPHTGLPCELKDATHCVCSCVLNSTSRC